MLLGGRAMFQGHRGASEGFRAGPMGRDKAQQGGGGGIEELRLRVGRVDGEPQLHTHESWPRSPEPLPILSAAAPPGRVRAHRAPSGAPPGPVCPPGLFLRFPFVFFWRHRRLGAKGPPRWDKYLIVRSTF